MLKLLKFLENYKNESVAGPIFKLIEAALDLVVPLVVSSIIDKGIALGDTDYIRKMCVLLVIIAVAGLVFSVTAQYFAAKAAVGFSSDIRKAVFGHMQSLSFTQLDSLGSATLITRMTSDVNQVQNGTNLTLRLLLRSPFVVFGAMIMAFFIDRETTVIFASAIIALSVVIFGIMLICIPLYKKVQSKLDNIVSVTKENLEGARVIRAFRMEKDETDDFTEKNNELTAMQKFTGRISALMNPVTYVMINLAIVWLIHTGALRVNSGLLTQGALVALYNYMSQILVELIKLANLIINITKAFACGNRIQAVLDIKPEKIFCDMTMGSKDYSYAVEIVNASLMYKDAAAPALENINLKVKRGETVGIIGGTGSGKSSLVNMLPGFYTPSEGRVKLYGVKVNDYSKGEIRRLVGIVPQKATLFKGTIRKNMWWGKSGASDEEIMEALEIAQAADIVRSKEGGLDYIIEQDGRNLSGGQKQRLTIARAIIRKPSILILDDSASALDFATDAALRKSLRENLKGTTVFIVSQRAASVMYADKILVLDDGRAVGEGTHEELMESCEVYREIFFSQFKKEDAENG